MLLMTRSHLGFVWCVLASAAAVASLLPGVSLHNLRFPAYINSNWVHFLAYIVVAALPLLAWSFRTGLAISFGIAILSVGLQVLHGLISCRSIDPHNTEINLLGIASGILLGLNILVLRNRVKERRKSMFDRSQSTLH